MVIYLKSLVIRDQDIMTKWFKRILIVLLVIIILFGVYVYRTAMSRLQPRPSMKDTPTTFIGFNHIGLSVKNLDEMVDFYQQGTGYEIVGRYHIDGGSTEADELYGVDSVSFTKVILKGPNMLLELTAYEHNESEEYHRMPPQGPGMTHTCYQSHPDRPTYDSFKSAGAEILSRGGVPVDNGLGVTYAYAYDPEGNMVELEEMSWTLIPLATGKEWAKNNAPWMTQVAIMSHDVKSLTAFYKDVLEIDPYRELSLGPQIGLDDIVDIDSVTIESAWFGMDTQGKKMELMQYTNPITERRSRALEITDLGYSFSFEVKDIQKEYNQLSNIGVRFESAPVKMKDFWEAYAYDIDGNIFSIRQAVETGSPLSLLNM